MSSCWPKFLIRGNALYDYMISNIDSMLSEYYIKYFDIIDIRNQFMITVDNIKEMYGQDIRAQLLLWIKNELKEDRLFKKELWKPFRDLEVMTDMVLGYKYMFKYEQYYFQLCIDSYYDINNEFINGIYNNNFGFFVLALYGWIDNNCENLQPDNKAIIPHNNIIPDRYWQLN